jgi:hypothetical protein
MGHRGGREVLDLLTTKPQGGRHWEGEDGSSLQHIQELME